MRNQAGFTFPLSLCLLMLFNVFFLLALEQGLSERRLYNESEKIMAAEYYLLSSVKEAELQMQSGKLSASGRFSYSKGVVDYQRRALSPAIDEITLTLKLHTTEQWIGIAHYDKTQQKMVRWIEKN
jgi:hypothetical protein